MIKQATSDIRDEGDTSGDTHLVGHIFRFTHKTNPNSGALIMITENTSRPYLNGVIVYGARGGSRVGTYSTWSADDLKPFRGVIELSTV